ncbi:hypothetical protein AOZ06_47005 [Kibdelosporangium phytohabitans]|uniref:Uncharacterized protein n=1 Tax=Kibdelosporangium phytohabitans TaxID=860235 RepID=A0A0N7F571_9PSEU|nr:hypothetical protein AOZ06_47005 [Kibdelosporangium phytohabitans]
MVEDFCCVAVGVLAGEFAAGAFADSLAVVFGVLELAEFCRWGEFAVVLVCDACLGQGCL